jgi:hypothetical protein
MSSSKGIKISGEGVLHRKSSELVKTPVAKRQIAALKYIKTTNSRRRIMSDYTVVSFPIGALRRYNRYTEESLRSFLAEEWDAWSLQVKSTPIEGTRATHDYYELTISELDLGESMGILNKLKQKYSIRFYIEYGVY